MSEKHKMTEKLKVVEVKVHNDRIDLKAIERKLNIAYKYEDELLERLNAARKNTGDLKEEFFKKAQSITEHYRDMKSIFNVFTQHYYEGSKIQLKEEEQS